MKYITAIMHAIENIVATYFSIPWRALCPVSLMRVQRDDHDFVPSNP